MFSLVSDQDSLQLVREFLHTPLGDFDEDRRSIQASNSMVKDILSLVDNRAARRLSDEDLLKVVRRATAAECQSLGLRALIRTFAKAPELAIRLVRADNPAVHQK